MFAPHCDSSVLHAPGECQFCDQYPDWQAYRERARINFTGQDDPKKAPCPSTHFRPVEIVHRWYGNRPNPAGELPDFELTETGQDSDTWADRFVAWLERWLGR